MSDGARHVIEEALRLPVGERAAVVRELLASIDGEPDVDAADAWADEVERRARRAVRGESVGKDWETVRAEIESSRRRRRDDIGSELLDAVGDAIRRIGLSPDAFPVAFDRPADIVVRTRHRDEAT